jgi:hypothetical protein
MVTESRDEPGDAESGRERERLERRAQALFEDSVERVDARTRSKLTQARHAALDEIKQGSAHWRWLRAPVGGLAAIAVAAIVVVAWQGGQRTGSEMAAVPLDDFDIVADADNLEMLQDVEFYAWLDDR